jgi:hypothetical protein
MGFDPCNRSVKIGEFIETPTPKVGAHLEVWRFIPSCSPTLLGAWNVTHGLHSWLTPSQDLALVASPKLGLRYIRHYNLTCIFIFLFLVFVFAFMGWWERPLRDLCPLLSIHNRRLGNFVGGVND